MKPNYRNPQIKPQDLAIGKSFKKELLKMNPRVETCSGFIPTWSWSRDQAGPIGCEQIETECFVLPVAGENGLRRILAGIRKENPVKEFNFQDKSGVVQRQSIEELNEVGLLSVLRNLSWLVSETEDYQRAYRFDLFRQKYIVLRMDQLALETRFTRRRLSRLLVDYIRLVINSGEVDRDLQQQLLKEHRVSRAVLESFSKAALAVRYTQGKERKHQVDDLNKKYKAFIIEKKNAPRKGSKEIMIVSPSAAPSGRRQEEIRLAVMQIARLWALGFYIDEAKNYLAAEAIIKTLQEYHGLTEAQVSSLTKQSEYQLMYPSTPDLLPEMIYNITKGGQNE